MLAKGFLNFLDSESIYGEGDTQINTFVNKGHQDDSLQCRKLDFIKRNIIV